MNTRKAIWAMLAVGLVILFAVPTSGLDGFEAPTLREVARAFGVGVGPGYHNQPCPKYAAREYNKMLSGQQYPGCLAIQRSRLAGKVPHDSPQFIFPGEDGTPPCMTCGTNPAWIKPVHARPGIDLGTTTQVSPEPTPADADDAVDEPANSSDVDRSKPTGQKQQDAPFGEPELDLPQPEPLPEQDNRSIEELLEGIRASDDGGQLKSDFVPGEELRKRLTPKTQQIFQREFPSRQPQTGPQSSDRSSQKTRNSSWW